MALEVLSSMNLPLSIAVILSQFAVPAVDRDEVNRNDRLTSIAIAVNRAAERATCTGDYTYDWCKPIAHDANQVAAELTELAQAETDLRSNVHRDECGQHQCDAVRIRVKGTVLVMHRARSLWQLHRPPAWTAERWAAISGSTQQATDAAAWEAAKLLAGYRGMCRGTTADAFAGYGAGRCVKENESSRKRARATERIRLRIVQLRANEPEGC